ncbi:MAG TPA: hypothetical protein VF461_14685 [Gemmatimonadaceae bacterium]
MLSHTPDVERPEPRWPVIVAACAAVALHFALPPSLRPGTPWFLFFIVGTLVIAATVFRRLGMHRQNSWASYGVLGALALGLLYGVVMLIVGLMRKTESGTQLLTSAGVLWSSNVIVFASWYWRLDGGGPNERERREAHTRGAFLFPQMTITPPSSDVSLAEEEGWRPSFVDYLFLAFNTSTAFSPTDVPPLSPWAKGTMMLQSVISLATVVVLAGRAVNIF